MLLALAMLWLLGGEICILKHIRADDQAEVVALTKGRFPEGLFSRPDISYDGKRIVFCFADANVRERVELLSNDTMDEAYRESLGNKTYFQLWEMELGEGMPAPRQILICAFAHAVVVRQRRGRADSGDACVWQHVFYCCRVALSRHRR